MLCEALEWQKVELVWTDRRQQHWQKVVKRTMQDYTTKHRQRSHKEMYTDRFNYSCRQNWININKVSSPILVTERWARSWSQCTGSQPAGDFLRYSPSCRLPLFPPGLRSPSQPKNITVLRPVPSYTAIVTRAHRCEQLAQVVTQMAMVRLKPTT